MTARSDIYSLGVVLYELLTGDVPFTVDNKYQLSEQILRKQAPTPEHLSIDKQPIPKDLQAINLKALEKDERQRYVSAEALADDLRRFVGHRTVYARRPNWIERLRRLILRHPVAGPLSAMAVVAILGAAGVANWQAKQAGFERDQARAERDRAEQVTAVLTDLFDSDPFAESQGRRDDLTLREFLLSRAETIGPKFENQPELQARLFQLFGNLLTKLSLFEQAQPYSERAVELQRSLHPNGIGEPLAIALNSLGTLRQYQARFPESEALFRESLHILEELYGEQHQSVALGLNDLGTLLHYWGDPTRIDEALELSERQLAIDIALLGPDSLQAARDYNSLGASYQARGKEGDLERAFAYLQKALAIRQTKLVADHPRTATVMSNLANMLHDLGRLDEADQMFTQALTSLRKSLGNDNTRVADVLFGYGHLQLDAGEPLAAENSFSESIDIYRDALGTEHPYVAETILALGRAQLENERPLLAVATLRSAIDALASHPQMVEDRLSAQYRLALALSRSEQYPAAREVINKTLSEIGAAPEHQSMRQSLQQLLDQIQ